MVQSFNFENQQHGRFTIEKRGRVIAICAYDAWNEQTSELFRQTYMEVAQALVGSPWACLINFLEWELGTAEILSVGQQLNAWSFQHNQRFSAIVSKTSLHRQLIEKVQEPTKSIEHQYFTEVAPAYAWLNSLGMLDELLVAKRRFEFT